MRCLSIEPLSGCCGIEFLASLPDLGADQQMIVKDLKCGLQTLTAQFTRKRRPHGLRLRLLEIDQ